MGLKKIYIDIRIQDIGDEKSNPSEEEFRLVSSLFNKKDFLPESLMGEIEDFLEVYLVDGEFVEKD